MNNTNLALKDWGRGIGQSVILFTKKKEAKAEKPDAEIIMEPSNTSTNKRCMESVLRMIDERMAGIDELEKMGFVAGVCKGQIMGYEMAGCITTRQAEQLTNYLYAKWEAMRTINNM